MNCILAPLRAASGLAVVAIGIVIVTPSDAWAYVDPGTGSYLFQIAAAGGLAALYSMRRYWSALVSAVRGRLAGTRGAHDVE